MPFAGDDAHATFWLLLANRATDDYELWQVSGTSSRTWNKRRSGGSVAAGGGTFALSCEVRSGAVEKLPGGMNNYAATIPAGKVGVWAGSGTQSVKADDFKMLDMGMPWVGTGFQPVEPAGFAGGTPTPPLVRHGQQHIANQFERGERSRPPCSMNRRTYAL